MSELEPLRALAALAGLLAVLALGAWLLRRVPRLLPTGGPAGRLAVVETRWLDPRTRLVLVRLDSSEHLLLVAGGAALAVTSQPASSARGEG